MKSKTVTYSIEEPCHEDWGKMKPEAQGRFCSSCSKTVVDFSSMSDFSIISYLESRKNESVCGRFRPEQMNRPYTMAKPHQSFSFDLKAVALGLALSTFSAIHADAQVTPIDTTQVIYQEPLDGMVVMMEHYDHSDEPFASGNILVDGKPYKMVMIQLMDDAGKEILTVNPDENGAFKILLDWSKKPSFLRISGPGIITDDLFFSSREKITRWNITLYRESPPIMLGFVKSR